MVKFSKIKDFDLSMQKLRNPVEKNHKNICTIGFEKLKVNYLLLL